MNIASNGRDDPTIAWIVDDEVVVAQLDPESGSLTGERDVSGSRAPVRHPIERPALAVRPDGLVDVAFTSFAAGGGSVYYTTWDGQTAAEPALLSGAPLPETNLVHMTLTADGLPVVSWLEDSTLSVAVSHNGSLQEIESVDELVCDCCNQAPLTFADTLVVAYRDLEVIDGLDVRDVVLTRSEQGGTKFGAPIRIADDPWQISGCPFSGPSAVVIGDEMVVAWMDARQSVHPDQDSSTIWVDRSNDGGASFGPDLALTDAGLHRWPVLAVDSAENLHVVWVTQGTEGGIVHAASADRGKSFGATRSLVPYSSDGGSPRAPSIVAAGRYLFLTWADNNGGSVAAWPIESLSAG
jgi:hypothetical protein